MLLFISLFKIKLHVLSISNLNNLIDVENSYAYMEYDQCRFFFLSIKPSQFYAEIFLSIKPSQFHAEIFQSIKPSCM